MLETLFDTTRKAAVFACNADIALDRILLIVTSYRPKSFLAEAKIARPMPDQMQ
jgi:hypothetical protein